MSIDRGSGRSDGLHLTYMTSRSIPPEQLAFQESLIAERESDIREIEGGIHELNEIFRDLGKIVEEQGGMIGELEHSTARWGTSVTNMHVCRIQTISRATLSLSTTTLPLRAKS